MKLEHLGLTPEDELAPVQYIGSGGITAFCIEAVQDLLQSNLEFSDVRLLTNVVQEAGDGREQPQGRHGLLFELANGRRMAVKSGFSSGYGGEGPSGLSYVLQLLEAHGLDPTEVIVEADVIRRLDSGVLTYADVEAIDEAPTHRGIPYAYSYPEHRRAKENGLLSRGFPFVMPFAILDPRMAPLAVTFWSKPNDNLRSAFVLLEEAVRARTGLSGQGAELFRRAFNPPDAKLLWSGVDKNEVAARTLLFESVYRVFRNPRHHRELNDSLHEQLREFLTINHLLCLEAEAKRV